MDPGLKPWSGEKSLPRALPHSIRSARSMASRVTHHHRGREGTDGPGSLSALNRPQSFSVLKNL